MTQRGCFLANVITWTHVPIRYMSSSVRRLSVVRLSVCRL